MAFTMYSNKGSISDISWHYALTRQLHMHKRKVITTATETAKRAFKLLWIQEDMNKSWITLTAWNTPCYISVEVSEQWNKCDREKRSWSTTWIIFQHEIEFFSIWFCLLSMIKWNILSANLSFFWLANRNVKLITLIN